MHSRALRGALGIIALSFLLCLSAHAEETSSPRINYILHCQGCHLADGAGTPDKVPALKNEVGRFLHVTGGREFLIQVPGTSQSPLSDAEVAAVLVGIVVGDRADLVWRGVRDSNPSGPGCI